MTACEIMNATLLIMAVAGIADVWWQRRQESKERARAVKAMLPDIPTLTKEVDLESKHV